MKNPPDLLALVCYIKAMKSGRIPATHGRYIHAGFLSMVSQFSDDLSSGLHGTGQSPRPFTLSGLHGGAKHQSSGDSPESISKKPFIPIEEGEEYWLRITSLKRELSRTLLDSVQDYPLILYIKEIPFQIQGFSTQNHDFAGIDTYTKLNETYLSTTFEPSPLIGLKFLSATTFRSRLEGSSQRRNLLFPLPSLVFSHLLRRWNQFSPTTISPISDHEFDQCIMVSGYHMRTRILDFGSKGRQIGFTGYCEYRWDQQTDLEILKIAHLLSQFSFFSGIGYGTGWGMGQVQYIIP